MKLRNKNTGEVVDAYSINAQDEIIRIQYFTKNGMLNHFDFDSIEEMNNVFEDYKPAEPLIKDEKIRKAVRAWAEVNLISDILYDKDKDCIYSGFELDDTAKKEHDDKQAELRRIEKFLEKCIDHRTDFLLGEEEE